MTCQFNQETGKKVALKELCLISLPERFTPIIHRYALSALAQTLIVLVKLLVKFVAASFFYCSENNCNTNTEYYS